MSRSWNVMRRCRCSTSKSVTRPGLAMLSSYNIYIAAILLLLLKVF